MKSRECFTLGCDGVCAPNRPRVFCLSLGDWLDDEVPIEWLADLLRLIHETPNLDWLLLTKRPQNWLKRFEDAFYSVNDRDHELGAWIRNWLHEFPPANVWIGVSAGADQDAALAIPARLHFLSCEPMLHPLDTTHAAKFSWIIFGGESGKKARPCEVKWIREGIRFCRTHGAAVAPFVKQLGANAVDHYHRRMLLKNSHGGDMSEWPEDLRVREFPLDHVTQ